MRARDGDAHNSVRRDRAASGRFGEIRSRHGLTRRIEMELGMIGLGKMGAFMTERLVRGGNRVVGLDRDAAAVQKVVEKGAGGADSIDKLIGQLKAPRAVWLMVPAGAPVDQTIESLLPHLP